MHCNNYGGLDLHTGRDMCEEDDLTCGKGCLKNSLNGSRSGLESRCLMDSGFEDR